MVVDSDGVHVVVFWIAHCVYPWYCGSAIYLYTFLKAMVRTVLSGDIAIIE